MTAAGTAHRFTNRPAPSPAAGLVLVWLLGALTACGGFDGMPGANLVLITVDTLRADHLGAYGDTRTGTPAFDALAAEGLVFERVRTAAPITTPALGTLMTGRLPRNHAALNNGYDLDGHNPTLAQRLSEDGYRTAAFLPMFIADKPNFKAGFDAYSCPPVGRPAVPTETLVQLALAWIRDTEQEGDGPWFVWLHALEPHSTYSPPRDLLQRALPPDVPREVWEPLTQQRFEDRVRLDALELQVVRALYLAEVEAVDRALEPLLTRALEPPQGARPQVTILTADHGEMLHEHEEYVGHTTWLYEPMLRIPLILHFSDGRFAGQRSRTPAFGTDLLPTAGRALGFEYDSLDNGRDLFRYLDDESLRLTVSETFAPEGRVDQQAIVLGDFKLHRAVTGPGSELHPPYPRLFALDRDPGEVRDLASDSQDQVERLERLYSIWLGRQRDLTAIPRTGAVDPALRAHLEALGYTQGPPAQANDR